MYNILNIITAFILIVNAKDDYCAKTWYFHNGADYPAVSVFCADSGTADALSTALFCMSYEDGLALVESIGNVEVVWIEQDGTQHHTAGIADWIMK